MRNFGERLKQFRKQAGLTQDDIAAQLGLTKNAVSQWERNVSQPDLANLVVLRTMLRVSLDVLVGGDEPSDGGDAVQSAIERCLVERFNALSSKKRAAILDLLDP
jgi:transcriptional regulator with XRE-family HTH domain